MQINFTSAFIQILHVCLNWCFKFLTVISSERLTDGAATTGTTPEDDDDDDDEAWGEEGVFLKTTRFKLQSESGGQPSVWGFVRDGKLRWP